MSSPTCCSCNDSHKNPPSSFTPPNWGSMSLQSVASHRLRGRHKNFLRNKNSTDCYWQLFYLQPIQVNRGKCVINFTFLALFYEDNLLIRRGSWYHCIMRCINAFIGDLMNYPLAHWLINSCILWCDCR